MYFLKCPIIPLKSNKLLTHILNRIFLHIYHILLLSFSAPRKWWQRLLLCRSPLQHLLLWSSKEALKSTAPVLQEIRYSHLILFLYPCLLPPRMSGNPFFNGFRQTSVFPFLTGRDRCTWCCRSQGWKGHLPLSLSTSLCVQKIAVSLCSRAASSTVLLCEHAYVFRVTLALRVPSDRLASKEQKEKLYENLNCAHWHVYFSY